MAEPTGYPEAKPLGHRVKTSLARAGRIRFQVQPLLGW
jgi:hypothetical protein